MTFLGIRGEWLLRAAVLAVALTLGFQNCSEVTFSDKNESSGSSSSKSLPEGELVERRSTNGDGYSGKVTVFARYDTEDLCTDEILSEIHLREDDFYLMKQDCEPLEAVLLEESEVTQVDEFTIVYQEASYEREFPASCMEILLSGNDEGNGYYEIDPDGRGGRRAGDDRKRTRGVCSVGAVNESPLESGL